MKKMIKDTDQEEIKQNKFCNEISCLYLYFLTLDYN